MLLKKGATTLKRMKLLALTVCVIAVTSFAAHAGKKQLSPEPGEMVEALMALQREPNDAATQERYLKVFPHDYASFMNLFSYNHPLYDGHQYILALTPLCKTHPMEVGRLLVGLSKDAHATFNCTNAASLRALASLRELLLGDDRREKAVHAVEVRPGVEVTALIDQRRDLRQLICKFFAANQPAACR